MTGAIVPQISDREQIRIRLERNRPWTAYALADLEPGYFEKTAWFCDAGGLGLTLLYRGFSRPLIFCIENPDHPESILDEIESIVGGSDRYLVSGPENLPAIRRRYHVLDERPMNRMTLDARHFRPAPGGSVARLGPDHLGQLNALYDEGPPEFFSDSMLTEGIYFGLFEGAGLVAVAGTHIVSHTYSIGALGNIYTRADRRSRGYCTQVTSVLSDYLLKAGITTLVLNVRENNDAAIRVYGRLGYRAFCRYFELAAAHR